MAIIDDLKAIGTMMGIKPTGNNIMEVVKSMKAQLEEKKIPVTKETKKFAEDVTKEPENQDAPTISSEKKSRKKNKEFKESTVPTVKFN